MSIGNSILTALKNNVVSSALMGTAAPLLIPKKVRPKAVRSDLMVGLAAGAAWYMVCRAIDSRKVQAAPAAPLPVEAVNGVGNMFNSPWMVRQSFESRRRPVVAQKKPYASAKRRPTFSRPTYSRPIFSRPVILRR